MKMEARLGVPDEIGHNRRVKCRPSVTGKRRRFDRVRTAISKYVTIERDALLKDPDWPHLWDHKR